MKAKGRVTLPALLLAALTLTCCPATQGRAGEAPPTANSSPTSVSPLITTARPTLRSFTRHIPWTGTVEVKAKVELTAAVAGRLTAILVADQQPVLKGQLVVRLGGPRLKGERAGQQAQIDALQARLELARQTIARLEENLHSQLATKDQLAVAQGEQIKLETSLREARLKLATLERNRRIVAPLGGTFTNRHVNPGQELQAGQPLGEIIDTTQLRIVATGFPPPGSKLPGKVATVRLDGSHSLIGSVQSVLPQSDPSGALQFWIEGAEFSRLLRPGQKVTGELTLVATAEALAVPESAIVYDEEQRPLLFVTKNGSYQPQRVELGLQQDGWVEIVKGVESQQAVVTLGAYELFYNRFTEQFKVPD